MEEFPDAKEAFRNIYSVYKITFPQQTSVELTKFYKHQLGKRTSGVEESERVSEQMRKLLRGMYIPLVDKFCGGIEHEYY